MRKTRFSIYFTGAHAGNAGSVFFMRLVMKDLTASLKFASA